MTVTRLDILSKNNTALREIYHARLLHVFKNIFQETAYVCSKGLLKLVGMTA